MGRILVMTQVPGSILGGSPEEDCLKHNEESLVWDLETWKRKLDKGVKEEGWISEEKGAVSAGTFHLPGIVRTTAIGQVSGHSDSKGKCLQYQS